MKMEMWMKSVFRKKEKLLVFAGLAAVILIARLCQIPCLFKTLFGIPCMTCGMTRAYLALFRLDIKGAFAYHPLFWTIPFLALLFWFDGKLFPKKSLNIALLIAVLSLLFARWLFILL